MSLCHLNLNDRVGKNKNDHNYLFLISLMLTSVKCHREIEFCHVSITLTMNVQSSSYLT